MHAPSWKAILHKLFRIISPTPLVGGLAVSNASLRFLRIEDNRLREASVDLPSGTITEGIVRKSDECKAALIKLHAQIVKGKEVVQVILSVPSPLVYTEAFKLPFLSKDKLREAAQLNLKMISPLGEESAYADAEQVSDIEEGGQVDFLGAFARRDVVEGYNSFLHEAGFSIVAVEFPGLALARVVRELGAQGKVDAAKIVIFFSDDGLEFSLLRGCALYFHYVYPMLISRGDIRDAERKRVEEAVIFETQKVVNFSSSHLGGKSLDGFLISTPKEYEWVREAVAKNFGLPADTLSFTQFSNLSPSSLIALGSAFRGTHPRSTDTEISLTAVGTERGYEEHRLLYFANVWRNIIVAFVGFFAVVYLIAYGAIAGYARSVTSDPLSFSDTAAIRKEITPIQTEAKEFNRTLGLYVKAKNSIWPASQDLAKLSSLAAQQSITITRMSIDASRGVTVAAQSPTDTVIPKFQRSLESEKVFQSISLPLASIRQGADGFTFQVRFRLAR